MSTVALTLIGLAVVVANALFPRPVQATEPPPPSNPTLTVLDSGGDEHTRIRVESLDGPLEGEEQVDHPYSYATTYPPGTEVKPYAKRVCPCDKVFDHWESDHPTVQSDLNSIFGTHTFDMPSNSTTVTAVYQTLPEVFEFGTILTVMAGGVYGANVMYVYLNAAGYTLREDVWFGSPAPPFCECDPTRTIHQRLEPIELQRCDEFGNPDPSGRHGMMGDQVVNRNGAPATLPGKGISLPCVSLTEQDVCVGNGCMEWVFHHSQSIYVIQTSTSAPLAGYVRVYVTNAGSGQKNW